MEAKPHPMLKTQPVSEPATEIPPWRSHGPPVGRYPAEDLKAIHEMEGVPGRVKRRRLRPGIGPEAARLLQWGGQPDLIEAAIKTTKRSTPLPPSWCTFPRNVTPSVEDRQDTPLGEREAQSRSRLEEYRVGAGIGAGEIR